MSSPPLTGVRGWLLFLCIALTILNPVALIAWVTELDQLATLARPHYPAYAHAVMAQQCLFGVIALYSLRTGLGLWRVEPRAVAQAKIFLVVYFVALLFCVFLPYLGRLPPSARATLIEAGSFSALRTLVFSAVWTAYLTRSRRVQNTYGPTDVSPDDVPTADSEQ